MRWLRSGRMRRSRRKGYKATPIPTGSVSQLFLPKSYPGLLVLPVWVCQGLCVHSRFHFREALSRDAREINPKRRLVRRKKAKHAFSVLFAELSPATADRDNGAPAGARCHL